MELKKVAEALRHKHYEVHIAEDSEEARAIVKDLLKGVKSIGKGGSQTLRQSGIWDDLLYYDSLEGDDRIELFSTTSYKAKGLDPDIALRKGMTADAYICSVNSMSEDGTIYNVDGIGNRVGAIIYGPRKVIFVVGRNKIHRTKEEAWDHLRNVICPKHCITNKKPNPCVKVGRCVDCSLETMECKVTSKLSYALPNREYIVVLVNEDLGY
ncbi:MAG: lactate utilization protein [Clostridia bacterium]|nr:lactate utilization protein [Clostridia bacterium]